MADIQYTYMTTESHEISLSESHNPEVLGSIPSWSTLKHKELRKLRNSLFLVYVILLKVPVKGINIVNGKKVLTNQASAKVLPSLSVT